MVETKEVQSVNQATNSLYTAYTYDHMKRPLEPVHLKLKQGRIHIPGTRKGNSPALELKPLQILELHEYLTRIRPRIL